MSSRKTVDALLELPVIAIRVLTAVALGLVAILSGHIGFLTFMPMRYWVDYRAVNILDWRVEGRQELVEVQRIVSKRQGVIPVMRFTELQERLPDGATIQHCPVATWTTAEYQTNPRVIFEIGAFIGQPPACDLSRLDGIEVYLQVTYDIELPYGLGKQKAFFLGPFAVRGGELHHLDGGNRQSRALGDGSPVPPLPHKGIGSYRPQKPLVAGSP